MLNLLGWLASGTTLIWVVLAIFAPSLLQAITPIIKSIVEGISGVISTIWQGLKNIFTSFEGVMALLALCFMTSLYTGHQTKKVVLKDLHSNYKFVPKKKEVKTLPQMINPLEWWR